MENTETSYPVAHSLLKFLIPEAVQRTKEMGLKIPNGKKCPGVYVFKKKKIFHEECAS